MKKTLMLIPLCLLLVACGPRQQYDASAKAFMAVDNSLVYMVKEGHFDGLTDQEVEAIMAARNIAMEILRKQGKLAAEDPPRSLSDYAKERFQNAIDFMKSLIRGE